METKIKEVISLHKAGELQKAEHLCLEIINKEPNNFFILYLLGIIALQKKDLRSSVDLFNRSIKAKHDNPDVHYNLGVVLYKLNELESALNSYKKTIELKPDYVQAYYNSGIILKELGNIELALENYQKAIKLKPGYAEAYYNCGIIYKELKQFDKAIENYEKTIELKPNKKILFSSLIELKNKICDWKTFEKDCKLLESKIIENNYIAQPFHIVAIYDSPKLQKKCANLYIQEKCGIKKQLTPIKKHAPNKKIRLGYFSADFCEHPSSWLTAYMFELHDKSKFELIGFSFGRDKKDEMYNRISSTFDEFYNVHSKTDRDIAELSRELKIDIAIDMTGLSNYHRPCIFAERCAPIQIIFLGYPGTTGSDFIDYIIADKIIIPKEKQEYYTEKIIYLPDTWLVNDYNYTKKMSNINFSREELGLPKDSFVFSAFCQTWKITPDVFDIWMNILKGVNKSVLWLLEDNNFSKKNIKIEANKRGVDSNRIIFGKEMNLPDHLARNKLSDLLIDTFPYTAHKTCSDALWAGVPAITRKGQSFASRVAASILNAIDLPELITHNEKEYEKLAIELGNNTEKLKQIKQKLEKNKNNKPLFNTELFTKNIEKAYQKVHQKYLDGKPCENIEVN